MARKKKWQYLETSKIDLDSMSRKMLLSIAEGYGLIPDRRVKTTTIREALTEYLKKLDEEADEIVENYQTFEEIESNATIIPKRLPRKLDI